MPEGTSWVRLGSLLVGLLGMTVAGVNRSFNVIAIPLKLKFGFTQTEIEVIAGAGNIGEFLGIPAFLLFAKYGARRTSLLGLVLSCSGFVLLWMATHLSDTFKYYYMLVAVFYFIAAHGTAYTYISCLTTNIDNFSLRHRWRAKAGLELSHIIGAPIYAGIYSGIFAKLYKNDTSNSLGNFFVMQSICIAAVNILGIIFLKNPSTRNSSDLYVVHTRHGNRHHGDEGSSNEYASIVDSHESFSYSSISGTSSAVLVEDELPDLKTIFKSWSVQYIMWTMTLSVGVGLMFYNNVTTILHSLHWEEYDMLFTVLLPLTSLVAHFIITTTSDYLSQKVPKSVVMLILIIILGGSQFFLIFYVSDFDILIGASVMVYVACPCLLSVGASLLRDRLAAVMFEKTWWIISSVIGVGSVFIQLSFGAIYDGYVLDNRVKHNCYGSDCFMWSFIMSSCVCMCAAILHIGLIKQEW